MNPIGKRLAAATAIATTITPATQAHRNGIATVAITTIIATASLTAAGVRCTGLSNRLYRST
jgi:hypothetical protein